MPDTHYRRLLTPPKGSFFLFGVRGAGKSTWATVTNHRGYCSPFTVARASVKPITSDQYPLPAKRPRRPVTTVS